MRSRGRSLRTVLSTLFVLFLLVQWTGCAGMRPAPEYNRKRSEQTGGRKSTSKKEQKPRTRPKHSSDRSSSPKSSKRMQRTGGGDRLDREIAEWWGTPYRYGGSRKYRGVDCSAYVRSVFKAVYGVTLPRTSSEQYQLGTSVKRKQLRRGDLVFFNTNGRGVSHVGIYLGRERFTHSCNSDGVTINKLTDAYYRKRYIGARRLRR